MPDACYAALGLIPLGSQVVRADIAERIAARLRKAARKEPFAVDPRLAQAGLGASGPSSRTFSALSVTRWSASAPMARNDMRGNGPSRRRTGKEEASRGEGSEPRFSPFAKLSVLATGQRPDRRDPPRPCRSVTRLDKWLCYARFFKTRGLAQKACESGRIRGQRPPNQPRRTGLSAPATCLTFVQGRVVEDRAGAGGGRAAWPCARGPAPLRGNRAGVGRIRFGRSLPGGS